MTEGTGMQFSLAGHRVKVDFREAKVPFLANVRKSGLNVPWLERAVC